MSEVRATHALFVQTMMYTRQQISVVSVVPIEF